MMQLLWAQFSKHGRQSLDELSAEGPLLHSPKFIPIEIGIPSWIPNLGWNSKLNTDLNWNSKWNSWSVGRVLSVLNLRLQCVWIHIQNMADFVMYVWKPCWFIFTYSNRWKKKRMEKVQKKIRPRKSGPHCGGHTELHCYDGFGRFWSVI